MPVIAWALVRPSTTRSESPRAATAALIFPTDSSNDNSCAAPDGPNARGSSVSSIITAAAPAASSSWIVRMTLNALPYPWSASISSGTFDTRAQRCTCSASSVSVSTITSGAPSTAWEMMDPPTSAASYASSSAMRADTGSNTVAITAQPLPASDARIFVLRSVFIMHSLLMANQRQVRRPRSPRCGRRVCRPSPDRSRCWSG